MRLLSVAKFDSESAPRQLSLCCDTFLSVRLIVFAEMCKVKTGCPDTFGAAFALRNAEGSGEMASRR